MQSSVIGKLENEWNWDTGFFGQLRDKGVFDSNAYLRVQEIYNSIDLGADTTIDRRLVALLWYIPLIMTWQLERFETKGQDAQQLKAAVDEILGETERILGVP